MTDAMLINEGCDYLRVTSAVPAITDRLFQYGWTVAKHIEGWETLARPARMLGYEGRQVDQCFFGSRADGVMLQVSGDTARQSGDAIIRSFAKPTRIDFQITLRVADSPAASIQRAYDEASAHPARRGVPVDLAMTVGRAGPRALTVGKRSSQYYARIYDKGLESKEAQYQGCVRYEVEVKDHAAPALGLEWQGARCSTPWASAWVIAWFLSHGIRIPYTSKTDASFVPYRRPASTLEQKQVWLSKIVAPSVLQVANRYGLEVALYNVLCELPECKELMEVIEGVAYEEWPLLAIVEAMQKE